MKRTKLSAVFAFCLVLVIAVGLSGCSQEIPDAEADLSEDEAQSQVTQQDDAENKIEQIKGSLKELVEREESLHCSYEGTMEGDSVSQDIYLSDEKYRIEMETSFDGKTQQSYLINDGEWIYSWNSMTPQGIKMSHDFIEEQGGSEDLSVDMSDVSTYSCKPWSPKQSTFDVPSDIEFMNFDDLMQGMPEGMGEYPTG
jgi:hypothetical protein